MYMYPYVLYIEFMMFLNTSLARMLLLVVRYVYMFAQLYELGYLFRLHQLGLK